MGIMITYANYMKKNVDLTGDAVLAADLTPCRARLSAARS
jgi:SNF family Na+-dependent transporter